MLPALLTVFFFACSGISGERAARYLGGQFANLLRLFFAMAILGVGTLVFFPYSLRWETFGWLFLSGVVGFGFGDIALFLAYVRIGARLTVLLNLCTAPLWSSVTERVWLGTTLTVPQMAAGGVILCGVALAILSRPKTGEGAKRSAVGFICGVGAGMGQGVGAVISRRAFEAAASGGFSLNGFSAASQRICGGFLMVLAVFVVFSVMGRSHFRPPEPGHGKQAFGWLAATTLCGPVLGVSCLQWALIRLPAGLVNAVVAMTPIAMIPLTFLVDREKPMALSVAGACVAVAGVIWLLQTH